MAIARVTDYFMNRVISPAGMQQDMLISFNYKSPAGVHDPQPLVYVLEKKQDRFYGLNLHYDMNSFTSLVLKQQEKINEIIEQEWYRIYPEKFDELEEQGDEFSIDLVDTKDLINLKKKISNKDLETFLLISKNDTILRNYIYKRMTSVKKLVWK